jgi:hypothetical protein
MFNASAIGNLSCVFLTVHSASTRSAGTLFKEHSVGVLLLPFPPVFRQIFSKELGMDILRKNFRGFLAAAATAAGIGFGTGLYAQQSADQPKDKPASGATSKSAQPGKKEGQIIMEVPVLVMVPVQVSKDIGMDKGCWVKLYDQKDFQGDSFTLIGPINLPEMVGPFGFNWENKIRSLETGPKANLTIYDNRNFKDQDKFIDPNKKVPDLSKRMGFFDDFRSMMLSCI